MKDLGPRLLLAVAGTWAVVFLLWPGAPDAMLVDDAWYYLRTAQNLVAGFGISFDRQEPFNGFHPLWLLTLLPAAAPAWGPDTLARVVLLEQLGLTVLGVLLWSRAVGAGKQLHIVAALLLLNPWAAKILMCGQESALAFALTGAFVVLLREERAAWQIGVVAGLCVLARLDSVAWIGALLGAGLLHRRAALGVAAVSAAAIVLPWAIWSQNEFGTFVPVSAAIKSELAVRGAWSSWAIGAAAGGLFGAILWRFVRGSQPHERLGKAIVFGAALELGKLIALAPTNGVSIWYLWPILPSLLWAGAVIARSVRWAGVLVLLASSGAAWFLRVQPSSYAVATVSREAGLWIRENTPPGARLAGWDIGAVAAWSDRPFRNLEGLANSWRFKREVLDRRQLSAFLQSGEVDYVAQYFGAGPLERQLAASGLEPGRWEVVWSRPVEMRSVTSVRAPWRFQYVILKATGP